MSDVITASRLAQTTERTKQPNRRWLWRLLWLLLALYILEQDAEGILWSGLSKLRRARLPPHLCRRLASRPAMSKYPISVPTARCGRRVSPMAITSHLTGGSTSFDGSALESKSGSRSNMMDAYRGTPLLQPQ